MRLNHCGPRHFNRQHLCQLSRDNVSTRWSLASFCLTVPDCRRIVALPLIVVLILVVQLSQTLDLSGQQARWPSLRSRQRPVRTANFEVYAADAQMAQKVARDAERYRRELAIEWLGQELPDWNQPCPIEVKIERLAGGETSFAFMVNPATGRGAPVDWQMKIFGPPDRVLDAVLPHEITHTIFATHFGQPLPRWADEGACTTVEHESERRKNHQMLLEFLSVQPSRGIPFNQMFAMRNYPNDILPLYAQGFSVAKYLIAQKGRREFVNYVGRGLELESQADPLSAWGRATDEFYGYQDLSELQIAWLTWVKGGSSEAGVSPRRQVVGDSLRRNPGSPDRAVVPESTYAIAANSKVDPRASFRFAGSLRDVDDADGYSNVASSGTYAEAARGRDVSETRAASNDLESLSEITQTFARANAESFYARQILGSRTAQNNSSETGLQSMRTRKVGSPLHPPAPAIEHPETGQLEEEPNRNDPRSDPMANGLLQRSLGQSLQASPQVCQPKPVALAKGHTQNVEPVAASLRDTDGVSERRGY